MKYNKQIEGSGLMIKKMLLKGYWNSAKSNLENAIQDVVRNECQKKKLEDDFLNCAEFIATREKPSTSLSDSEKETQFSDKITALFSEENMQRNLFGFEENSRI